MTRRNALLIFMILYIVIALGGTVAYIVLPRPSAKEAGAADEVLAKAEDDTADTDDFESIDEAVPEDDDAKEEEPLPEDSLSGNAPDASISGNEPMVSDNEVSGQMPETGVSANDLDADASVSGNDAAADGREVTVSLNSGRLNVRLQPSKDAVILLTISNGEKAMLLSTTGEWSEIEYEGKRGYVLSSLIK